MPRIVEYSAFKGELTIGQIDNVDVRKVVDWFIDAYEKDYLVKVLGTSLYDSFMSGLSDDPIDAKWQSLKAQVTPALQRYVYFRYQNDQSTKTVGAGEMKPAALNAVSYDITYKNVRAWNQMVDYTKEILQFIDENQEEYPHEDLLMCKRIEFTRKINEFNL